MRKRRHGSAPTILHARLVGGWVSSREYPIQRKLLSISLLDGSVFHSFIMIKVFNALGDIRQEAPINAAPLVLNTIVKDAGMFAVEYVAVGDDEARDNGRGVAIENLIQ